jgi:hypothetical protein
MKRFIEGADRNQVMLLPESVEDYVGPDNPVEAIEATEDFLRRYVAIPERAHECDVFAHTDGASRPSCAPCSDADRPTRRERQ